MGNEKANSYWEAELPPNYDRVGIENFIRAKYVCSNFYLNSVDEILYVTDLQLCNSCVDFSLMHLAEGMKRKDGSQRMGSQVHLLEEQRRSLQCNGKELVKATLMGIPAIPELYLMRGRALSLLVQREMLHLEGLAFLCPLKVQNQYVHLHFFLLSYSTSSLSIERGNKCRSVWIIILVC